MQKPHFRNVTSPRGDEHLAGSTFFEFRPDWLLIDKKEREIDNFEYASEN
jgi:hypothetical protein